MPVEAHAYQHRRHHQVHHVGTSHWNIKTRAHAAGVLTNDTFGKRHLLIETVKPLGTIAGAFAELDGVLERNIEAMSTKKWEEKNLMFRVERV